MSLVPKEILLSHLHRSEGAAEVSLDIDFFRDLLYQAMPREWVGLTDEDYQILREGVVKQGKPLHWMIEHIEAKLKEKNYETTT